MWGKFPNLVLMLNFSLEQVFIRKDLPRKKMRISGRLIIRAMLECTVVACLCSEVSEVYPTVNCIFINTKHLGIITEKHLDA